MKQSRKRLISICINWIIIILTIIACYIMFSGFKFMHGYEPILESSKLGMFRFFTVDSNIFMGISSIIYIIYEYLYSHKKIKSVPSTVYIIKLMATTGVFLTFFVVFTYLGPISTHGIVSMLMNSNLFFHLLIPVLSVITFVFFENEKSIPFKKTFYGLVPMGIYAVYYITNILIHMENGFVSPKYDWYWFVQNGVATAFIVVPIILVIDYGLCFILWRTHHR